MRLTWNDPITFVYSRHYHLVLLIVWLIRYVEYLLTGGLGNSLCKEFDDKNCWGIFGCRFIDDGLLGVFVVLFIAAWIYRTQDCFAQYRYAEVVFGTIFLELILEIVLLIYFMFGMFGHKKNNTFGVIVWHLVWMFHLLLLIYKLFVVHYCFLDNKLLRKELLESITGSKKPDSGPRGVGTNVTDANDNGNKGPDNQQSDLAAANNMALYPNATSPDQNDYPVNKNPFYPPSPSQSPKAEAFFSPNAAEVPPAGTNRENRSGVSPSGSNGYKRLV